MVRKLDLMRFPPNLIGPRCPDKNLEPTGTTLEGWDGPSFLATLPGVPLPHTAVSIYG